MSQNKTNICLNMIVKNETKVLPRLFKSLHRYIDNYVIVDTGSSDGTPDLIKAEMDKYGIEGEVHHRPWVNFGHNRQEALELAIAAKKADWLLFIDADEELGVSDEKFYKNLQPGVSYNLEKHHGSMRYAVPHLIDISENKWEWKGVVHNYLDPLTDGEIQTRKDVWIIYHPGEGAKSQGVTPEEKYLKDARLLEAELEKYPEDARSQFYLGQSYRNAGFHSSTTGYYEEAYESFLKRSKMTNGWMDENYIALLEAGLLAHFLDKPHEHAISLLLQAHELRPQRAEAMYRLAKVSRLSGNYHQAYVFAKASVAIPIPKEGLFLNHMVYRWSRWDELSVAANQTGRHNECIEACDEILKQVDNGLELDDETLERIKFNRDLSVSVLAKNARKTEGVS